MESLYFVNCLVRDFDWLIGIEDARQLVFQFICAVEPDEEVHSTFSDACSDSSYFQLDQQFYDVITLAAIYKVTLDRLEVEDQRFSCHSQVFEAWKEDPYSRLHACNLHSAVDTSLDLSDPRIIDLVCASVRVGSLGYIVDKDFCYLSWKAAYLEQAVSMLQY